MAKNVDNDSAESEIVIDPPGPHHKNRSLTGCLFGFIAAITTSFGSVFLKIVDEHKVVVVLASLLFQYIMLMPIIQYKKVDVIGSTRKVTLLLLLRGFLSPIITICMALALSYLSLGDASAIFYTNPVFTVFFACIILNETCTILNIVLAVVTLVGFVLVAQPSFLFGAKDDENHFHYPYRTLGSMLALTASITAALSIIVVRKLGIGVHYSVSMLYTAWEGIIVVLVFMGVAGISPIPCFQSLSYILGSSVLYFLGHIFRTMAVQREKAGTISLILTSQVIFSFTLQYIFLGEVPTLIGGIGAGLILTSCVILALKSIFKAIRINRNLKR